MSLLTVVALGTLCVSANCAPTPLLPKVIDAVDRAISFFSSDYSNVNVDGLFGLRAGQGQIQESLRECMTSKLCPDELEDTLRRFSMKMEYISNKAMPYVENESPEYFERFIDTINSPYILEYRPSTFPSMDGVQVGHDKVYNEEEGDACYSRMLGTFREHERLLPQCNLTQPCLDLMTRQDTMRYTITHQLLYFIIIEHTGCHKSLREQTSLLTRQGIREIEDRLCQSIYKEASSLAETGVIDIGSQDLFLEQTILCGALGYKDFVKAEYINIVLRMQSPEGCFKMGFGPSRAFQLPLQKFKATSRKVLREQAMTDGCLSHKSGLGIATISLYLRTLVRELLGISA